MSKNLNEAVDRLMTDKQMPGFKSQAIRKVTEQCIKNTVEALRKGSAVDEQVQVSDIATYTPVLINLLRRVLPTLVGTEMVGVQALKLPTGRIFAQRVFKGPSRSTGEEVWGNKPATGPDYTAAPDTSWSGTGTDPNGTGMLTADGEALGLAPYGGGTPWNEMSFGIDYIDVATKTRKLKGRVTIEVIQDMRTVHGLDAEQELANILQSEIVAEIDREIVQKIYIDAKAGCLNTATPGTFDFAVDADGRWSMEKVQGLMLQIEREATLIAQETRRGRGNFILTSPEVAAYLSMANLISGIYVNADFTNIVNPVGISYYGLLCNRFKVYVDPYMVATPGTGDPAGAATHQVVVGYKGNEQDAGIYYCPYIPLFLQKAVDPEGLNPIIGFGSRYGIISSPWYCTPASMNSAAPVVTPATNSFYRKFSVKIDSVV